MTITETFETEAAKISVQLVVSVVLCAMTVFVLWLTRPRPEEKDDSSVPRG